MKDPEILPKYYRLDIILIYRSFLRLMFHCQRKLGNNVIELFFFKFKSYISHTNDTVLITVETESDVQIAKTVNDAPPDVEYTVTFTVTAHNNGPSDAFNIQIQDVMPADFININIIPSKGNYDPQSGIWTLNLTNGEKQP